MFFKFQNKATRLNCLKKCSLVQFPNSRLTQQIPFSLLQKLFIGSFKLLIGRFKLFIGRFLYVCYIWYTMYLKTVNELHIWKM